MCGFAGYIHNYGTFDKEEVIHKMADRIKHRGPDDAHYYICLLYTSPSPRD